MSRMVRPWVWALFGALCIGGCNGRPRPFGNPGGWPGIPGLGGGDDTYTILLRTFTDVSNHAAEAKRWRMETERWARWKGLYVVTEATHSTLYRGRYRSVAAARADLEASHQFRTPRGDRVYGGAIVVPLPGSDPGPPEWNLKNCKGWFTLQIAVFYDVPESNYTGRRRRAVEYCQRLRKADYDAFYYHGVSRSSVAIGCFDKDAVRRDRDYKLVVDPRIKKLQSKDEFPYMAINGSGERRLVVDGNTGKREYVLQPTQIVLVPGRKDEPQKVPPPPRRGDEEPRKAPGDPRRPWRPFN